MSSSARADPPTSYPPKAETSGTVADAVAPNAPTSTPNISPYTSWITNRRLNVKSHDREINQDPYALQQFLLTHASGRPTVLIECKGTHEEDQGTDSDGNKTARIVTDFHFTVDVSSALLPADTYGSPVWVVADKEPAKRGRYWRQVDYDPNPAQTPANLEAGPSLLQRREATRLERQLGLENAQRRKVLALPPWACISAQTPDPTGARLLFSGDRLRFENAAVCANQDFSDGNLAPPSKALADWAEEYCASRSPLKEFRFIRTVYGWNLSEIQRHVTSSLSSCHSGNDKKETATMIVKGTKIIVRPNNPLWWLYGLGIFRWFLYVTRIYPLIMWPIKRYLLGRCWKVAGSSFAFLRYDHLADSKPGETVAQYVARVSQTPPANDLKVTSRGISKIVGQRFADWYSANGQAFSSAAIIGNKSGKRNPIVV
ncbi:hypothetical protein FS837_010858 [Tulasnella sp. UAMH 9824]|nr:hypothetical protein FS837_010858 [Tulasnella sp. UAMH 9824]